ncbi:MAG: B12-binding domain-containing radical SAM protein [Oscillospiraceae bacterium]|nr:B12-binding domain-containing radical SAM protein [Oscillospiraceae bacterium]
MSNTVALISFYSPKSLGLRYLENALKTSGYDVEVICFKAYNSLKPKLPTEKEYEILLDFLKKKQPLLVGLSVMASPFIEVVHELNARLRKHFDTPIIWGGVYASISPEECMDYADYVIRGEGEGAIIDLANAIRDGADVTDIPNLAYKDAEGKIVMNPLRPLLQDLDAYGIPGIGGMNKHLIDNDTMTDGDPQTTSYSYEMSCSRGCPYVCSYCCSVAVMRLNKGGGKYVRFREVDNVISELLQAKKNMKKLKVIHFWDEIFSDDPKWIDDFVSRYKKEIRIPFEIWAHPLKTNSELIRKLRSAGLYKVVMGIQSGSPYIRKEIFHRTEKNDNIFKCDKIFNDEGVPQLIYDLMLRHPFETVETIKETYEMCVNFKPPFELQLHGLSFLPGADIVPKAIEMGLVTPEEMQELMNAPMQKQFDHHWKFENNDPRINYWYDLIFLTQFPSMRKQVLELAKDDESPSNRQKLDALCVKGKKKARFRYWKHKAVIVLKGTIR